MSFSANITGHVPDDAAGRPAIDVENQLVELLRAVVVQYPSDITGATFVGSHVGTVSLLAAQAESPAAATPVNETVAEHAPTGENVDLDADAQAAADAQAEDDARRQAASEAAAADRVATAAPGVPQATAPEPANAEPEAVAVPEVTTTGETVPAPADPANPTPDELRDAAAVLDTDLTTDEESAIAADLRAKADQLDGGATT